MKYWIEKYIQSEWVLVAKTDVLDLAKAIARLSAGETRITTQRIETVWRSTDDV